MPAYNLPTNRAKGDPNPHLDTNATNTAVNELGTLVGSGGSSSVPFVSAPAATLSVVSGTPDLTAAVLGWPHWNLDPASTEIVGTALTLPASWTRFQFWLYWTIKSNEVNNIVVQPRAHVRKGAGSIATGNETTGANATLTTSGVAYKIEKTNLGNFSASGDAAALPLLNFSVRRLGADASDTYTADLAVIGIELVLY